MNRQAWRDFLITVFFLGISFIIAVLSSIAAEQNQGRLAAIAAAISLILALLGALYIIPRLARNIRLEFMRFAVRTTVTVEGLIFVAFLVVLGFAAWNSGNNLLYLVLSAMLAFLIAANLTARLSISDVSIQLRFPDHIFAGEPIALTVTLLNHKRLIPSYSVMVEALAEEKADETAEADHEEKGKRRRPGLSLPIGKLAHFVLAPARASVRQRVEFTFGRRGRYPITGFKVSTKFPVGFFRKWRRVDANGEIIVYPKPRPLDDFYHALPMLVGQMQSHFRGSGHDLYSIRRYSVSDHIRYIDWKATAKTSELMVREHAREDEWRLTIVLDPTRREVGEVDGDEAGESGGFNERFERAVVMAASLAGHFISERSDVELITPFDELNVPADSGHDHLHRILRSLALVQPGEARRERPAGERDGDDARSGWPLVETIPVLADERRFKVLITSAEKGTIPASVWRSSHVVFMQDL